MSEHMVVDVVSPDGLLWHGDATSVIVRTTEGDIGILRDHEPLMAAMVPCAAEVVTVDGQRKVIAVGGGFISVFANRVSLLSDSAELAESISLEDAERELAALLEMHDEGQLDRRSTMRLHQLQAQMKAGERFAQLSDFDV